MIQNRLPVAIVGGLALLGYAVPLLVPPPASWPLPQADAGLWQRLFPAVPSDWIIGRLLMLLVGAILVAWACRGMPLRLPAAADDDLPRAGRAGWIALLAASAHALWGFLDVPTSRLGELVYFALLALPAGVLALADRARRKAPTGRSRRYRIVLGLLPCVWLVLATGSAWRSPRAAELVDMWIMIERIEAVVNGQQQILADSSSPGHSNAYMMLEGVPLLTPERLPSLFVQLQISHLLWTSFCGLLTGAVAAEMIGLPAAIVAQAVFLFSPWALSTAYNPGMNQIAPLCAGVLLALFLKMRRGSRAAIAAFGAVAGFSSTEPTVVLMALVLCVAAGLSLWRGRAVPWMTVVTGGLSGIAAILPAVPSLETLAEMARAYTFGTAQLSGMMAILLGQLTTGATREAMSIGRPAAVDIPLGALLSPFATTRIPIRMLGDSLFDPLGTALMAVGLVLCSSRILQRGPQLTIGLLLAALAHGFTARGDVVSHARLVGAAIPVALLAGTGFDAIRVQWFRGWRALGLAAAVATAVAVGGFLQFTLINPRILMASWLTTSFEAGAADAGKRAILLHQGFAWLYVDRIGAMLPSPPVTDASFSRFLGEVNEPGTDASTLFWSPGLEQDSAVSCMVCSRWPRASLFTLFDRSGLSRAYAASPAGEGWQPALPRERWTSSGCAPLCRPFGMPWLGQPQSDDLNCGDQAMSAGPP